MHVRDATFAAFWNSVFWRFTSGAVTVRKQRLCVTPLRRRNELALPRPLGGVAGPDPQSSRLAVGLGSAEGLARDLAADLLGVQPDTQQETQLPFVEDSLP